VRPTRPRDLLVPGLAAAVVAFVVSRLGGDASLPVLPIPVVVVVAALGAAELPLAASVRARLAGRPGTRPIVPIVVARVAALAKASSLTGALSAGAFAGLLADRVLRLGAADAAARDALVAAAGLVSGGLLAAAGLRLEGVCRAPDPPGWRDGASAARR